MFDEEAIRTFLEKVPDLRNPWKILLTIGYVLLLSLACVAFFFLDRIAWYVPLLTQFVMAVVATVISYVHFKVVDRYRDRYGHMAYRHYFYHLMLPYLVTWYACFFHPLFIPGPALLPGWLAIGLAVFFLLMFMLINLHIERAGFHMVTHGMDVYTVFPEEATLVYGKIYGFIRHPLYLSLTCGCIGLALLRNNALALLASLLQLIPALAAGAWEDSELIGRVGEEHRAYIRRTAALFPMRRLGSFLKLVFFMSK
jgi:protein-S-isoprenylcysteine O-methyltransferase Ste14